MPEPLQRGGMPGMWRVFSDGAQRLWQRVAAAEMRRRRAGYYGYLAGRLAQDQGRTLRTLFESDARRYGRWEARGWLSGQWAQRCTQQGGDLEQLWQGVFPATELRLLHVAQQAGGEALRQTLRDMAQAVALILKIRAGVRQTLAVALLACLILFATLLAVPVWTAPHMAAMFGDMPTAYYGQAARALFAFATGLEQVWPWLAAPGVILLFLLPASFTHARGRLRQVLDYLAPWRLHRDFHAVRFLALLQVLLRPRAGMVMPLREQLDLLWDALPPWLQWHVERMSEALARGGQVREMFATGLFERETRWMLDDMLEADGLDGGMAQIQAQLEAQAAAGVLGRAKFWRWCLLLLAAAGVLALLFWHYMVIDDLRHALANYQAAGAN
ncbi:hypothetical protein [Kerstersia gyiorum]|nr:hypothetical protein [Kerstersia gyiorum]MCH4271444.1 hypothetical protein [Kerstersia gyiorum]MCI1228372.1 hypothetical protein [Kerstersia gyiorum]